MAETATEKLDAERERRYTTALHNRKPDRVPIRPFAAEFAAKYSGYTCADVTHDFDLAFKAARNCARDFGWDATVGNMVYVWTGLTQSLGLKYYAIPGIHVPADTGFQYLEPSENHAYMEADEYDALIEDPTGFLFGTWLPRVSSEMVPLGQPNTFRNNLALMKTGMAMLRYFYGFGHQGELLKNECGIVSAISGILKAPFDILADKLRGYVGLVMDLIERPEKVFAACQALMPHLLHVALSGADPEKKVPITIWMHRGCVPFISHTQFDKFYWPTLRPIIEALWARGHQVLFYAEGNWNQHLSAFLDLPPGSIAYHADRGNIFEIHRVLGHKFCLSGGVPNTLLAFGNTEEVRDCCKKIIDEVAPDGGYILDASAIIQNDAKVANVREMTEFTQAYGIYPNGGGLSSATSALYPTASPNGKPQFVTTSRKPGVCFPWEEKIQELPAITGDPGLYQRIWEENEAWAYAFIWHCLLSF